MLKGFDKENVKILPGLFRERMDINRKYLMELDSQCLLQNFYLEAGIVMPGLQVVENPQTANLHWGWEAPTCQLRGHFLGHWMSAAAALVATDGDRELAVKLDYIVSELARCQELNGGEWIGSIPEKYMNMLVKNQYVWSPQYVMHKTIMGLIDAYKYARNKQALEVVDHLADWYESWTDYAKEKNPGAVYGGEQAGMLEVWADLYTITGSDKYIKLIESYMNQGIYKKLDAGQDGLTDDHANASIPLMHGAAKLYEITGDEKWRSRVESFWKSAVTDRGMYCTGGANAGEFWIPPMKPAQYMGDRNQEFCTVYNMVRTAGYLYKWTGDKLYGDYIERCLYNGFLSQQNSVTGMPTYFLPLSAGSKKKWGSKRHDFWCCHGTMVQAQTLYPDLIYFADENGIRVNQYIPSKLECSMGSEMLTLEQNINMKNYNSQVFFDEHGGGQISRWSMKFTVKTECREAFTVSLRVPGWVSGEPVVELNGKKCEDVKLTDGYIHISKVWTEDELDVFFPAEVMMEALPDQPELFAFVDGPIVLAGLTDSDMGIEGELKDVLCSRVEHTYSTFTWSQNEYVTRKQTKNFKLLPLYDVNEETYTVYFTKKGEC